MDFNQQQKDELLGRLFSGRGSRGDDAELERRLDEDAGFRRQFFAALDMKLAVDRNRAMLANELADLSPAPATAPPRSRTPWIAAAAAAALIAGSGALYIRNLMSEAETPAISSGPARKSLASLGACYSEGPDGMARSAELSVCDLAIGRRGALLRLFPQSTALVREDERSLTVELTQGAALLISPRQSSDYTVQIRAAGREARFLGTAVFVRIQDSGARKFLVLEGKTEVSERNTECPSSEPGAQSTENSIVVDAGWQLLDREASDENAPNATPETVAGCQLAAEEIGGERRADLEANVASLRRSAQREPGANATLADEDISAAARVIRSELAEGLRYEVTRANGETLTGVLFQSGAFYVVLTDDGQRITLQAIQVKEIRVLNPPDAR